MLQHIILDMLSRTFAWEKIAGPCITPDIPESVPHNPAEFAGNQNFHAEAITTPPNGSNHVGCIWMDGSHASNSAEMVLRMP
jgi:hypothetical protein